MLDQRTDIHRVIQRARLRRKTTRPGTGAVTARPVLQARLARQHELRLRTFILRRAGRLGLAGDQELRAIAEQVAESVRDDEIDRAIGMAATELQALDLRRHPNPTPPTAYFGPGTTPEQAAERQRQYVDMCGAAVLDVVGMITPARASAARVLRFLAEQRQAIAVALGTPAAGQFGARRDPAVSAEAKTPISGSYTSYGVAHADAMRAMTPDQVHSRGNDMPFAYAHQQIGTIGGRAVPLTTTVIGGAEFRDRPLMIERARQGPDDQGRRARVGMWEHTLAEHVGPVLEHVETLQRSLFEAYEAGAGGARLEQILASISWWLTNAMPWRRGTASINEMYLSALRLRFGLPQRQRRPGISLDLEAFMLPEADYVARFDTFHR